MASDPIEEPLQDRDEDLLRAFREAREGDLRAFEQMIGR